MIFLIIVLLFIILIVLFLRSAVFGGSNPVNKYINSPQFIKGRFRNAGFVRIDYNQFDFKKLMKETFFSGIQKKPSKALPIVKLKPSDFLTESKNPLELIWFGHSSVLIEINGKRIFIDPMLGKAAAPIPFAVRRFKNTLPVRAKDLPELDAVLLTHDHYDHLDYGTIKKIKHKVKHFYTPLGVAAHLIRWGIPEKNITELDWWQEINIDDIKIISSPTQHFSGRKMNERDMTLWCGWIIKSANHSVYFSGDSGYNSKFKDIGERHGPFDICFMESGQYHYMWKENHMTPEESAQAFLDAKGKLLVPVHWGAFSLAPHSWTDPIERMVKACTSNNIKLIAPKIGERIIPGIHEPNEEWWRNI